MLLETSDQSTTARSNTGTYPRSVGAAQPTRPNHETGAHMPDNMKD